MAACSTCARRRASARAISPPHWARNAVEARSSVLFLTLETLMRRLGLARHENRLERSLQQLTCPKLPILDDLGYLPLPREEGNLFFQLFVLATTAAVWS